MAQESAGVTGAPASPGLMQLFLAFTKIGLTSFGGGLSGWMMREFVQRRRWVEEGEFLAGLSLAQAFPGVNVVNLSIWIGYRLGGSAGALVSALGMVVPAMFVAILAAALFAEVAHYHLTHVILSGIAAAAVGLSLQMGVRAARRAAVSPVPALILLATFCALFFLRLPLLAVVLVMAPVSLAATWYRLRGAGGGGR
ncbi:chromate transporter [Roseomonas populi]|uniref:Chromate transporter n=1 Tax=Roseomonas populi TaxID=3121582 RepID=A0ABT1X665_9PROT|nr:chromate transporter [Roseomonas pecuniae]MCR0983592.1 chromate transporter [Roseomonas pecuniae]